MATKKTNNDANTNDDETMKFRIKQMNNKCTKSHKVRQSWMNTRAKHKKMYMYGNNQWFLTTQIENIKLAKR